MKNLLALILGAIVLCLVAVFVMVLGSPHRGAGENEGKAAPAPAPQESAGPTGDAALLSPGEPKESPSTAAVATPEAPSREDERRAFVSEDARWAEGRVLVPPTAPADDTLRVLALDRALSPEEILGKDGILRKLRDEPNELPEGVLAIGPVAADGWFRLPFPKDEDEGWIALDGRFLYLSRPACVDLASPSASATLLPKVGACLQGRVALPADLADPAQVLEDVEIDLGLDPTQFSMSDAESSWMFDREDRADGTGAFELRAIDCTRPRMLAVKSDDLATYSESGMSFEEGELRVVQIALAYGAKIRGRVLGPGDAPIAGAEVVAARTMIFGFAGNDGPKDTSREDGSFELRGVPAGSVGLVAKATGYLSPRAQRIQVAESQEVEGVVLHLEAGQEITGAVKTGQGGPVAGAKVSVRFDPAAMMGAGAMNAARGASGSAETDADGRFRVGGLGPGPFLVEASAPAPPGSDPSEPKGEWKARKSPVRPGTAIELELLPPLEVRGRVIDPEGKPISKFTLVVRARSEVVFMPGTTRREEIDDERGEFRVGDLHEGAWEIEARAKGFGPSAPAAVSLPSATPLDPIEILLRPEAGVAGVVRAPDGTPFPGAKVSVELPATRIMARLEGSLEVPETYSAEDGAFQLAGLGEGDQALVATHPDFAASEAVPVQVTSGRVTEGVEITLRKGAVLTGMVFDRDGSPLVGGQVILQAPTMIETNLQRTKEDGSFRFERLRPGNWTVVVMLEEIGVDDAGDSPEDEGDVSKFFDNMRFAPVLLKEGEETHVVLGEPPADPVAITGKVTHGGKPLTAGIVSFVPDQSNGFQDMKMDQVDGEGSYGLELNKPGKYLVQIQVMGASGAQQNSVEFTEIIPDAKSHQIDLVLPLGRIAGRVLGPEGDPLESARVTLFQDGGISLGSFLGGQYAELQTDGAGHYEFDFVRPGVYCVAAGGTPFGGAFGTHSEVGRSLQNGIRIGENETVDGIDFRLSKAGELLGIVRDASGAPVPNSSVFLRDEGGRLLERFSMTASGAEGSFQYTGLAAGNYEVSARAGNQATAQNRVVRISAGETSRIELVLAPATVVVVDVVDAEGNAVAASISVRDADGREWTGMIGWADMMDSMSKGIDLGVMRVGPLPPGRYTVQADASDGRSTKKPLNLDGNDPERKIKLHFK